MDKKIVGIVVIVALLVLGGGWWTWRSKSPAKMGIPVADKVTLTSEGANLWLNVGSKKISMMSVKLAGMKTLTVNKEVFNSEMVNSVGTDGKLNVVLGVMKSTNDLPSGKILVGKLADGSTLSSVEGKVTVAGIGSENPYELDIVR